MQLPEGLDSKSDMFPDEKSRAVDDRQNPTVLRILWGESRKISCRYRHTVSRTSVWRTQMEEVEGERQRRAVLVMKDHHRVDEHPKQDLRTLDSGAWLNEWSTMPPQSLE